MTIFEPALRHQPPGHPSLDVASGTLPGLSWTKKYVVVVVALDLLAALVAGVSGFVARFGLAPTDTRTTWHLILSLLLPVGWVAIVAGWRAYEPRFLGIGSEEFRRVFHAGLTLTAGVAIVSYLVRAEIARGYVLIALPMTLGLSLAGRYLVRKAVHKARRSGACVYKVIALGYPVAVDELIAASRREAYAGMQIVGACLPTDDLSTLPRHDDVPVLGKFDEVMDAVRRTGATTVAVTAAPEMDGPAMRRLSWQLQSVGAELLVAPAIMDITGPRIHIRPVSGLPLLHVEAPELSGGRRLLKGVVDRVGAASALLLLSPVLLVIAALIRLTSSGPALFKQIRIGRDGQPFTVWKFRSMYVGSDAVADDLAREHSRNGHVLFKMTDDPRITPVGRLLRRYSLDELPQFVNVLRGHMSLVGPRPPLPREVDQYADIAYRRLLVKPGLTGLWQISGRADLDWEETVRLDVRYVENWSLALDFMILWKTVFAVLRGEGAY